jgi:hypothetical protein
LESAELQNQDTSVLNHKFVAFYALAGRL